MPLIKFRTEDDKEMAVDERIVKFSELFNTLHENFETEIGKPLAGIKEEQMNLLVKFCDACDYTPIKFDKPIWKKDFSVHYSKIFSKNKKLESFYNELNYDQLCAYFKICYFYDSSPLKEFLYFKLYDIFNDDKKCINFFQSQDKDTIGEVIKIDNKKKNDLYLKYQDFLKKQIESLSPEEIEEYCLKCYP